MSNGDDVFAIKADEMAFLPFFIMEGVPEGKAMVYLLLGDRMAYTEWLPDEEAVKQVMREISPRAELTYIIIKNTGDAYEYESGVASAEGLTPYVMARVYLTYTRGEVMA